MYWHEHTQRYCSQAFDPLLIVSTRSSIKSHFLSLALYLDG